MNKVPHITHEDWIATVATLPKDHDLRPSEIANKALELRYAPKPSQEQPLISADEARKLGAGNAEYFDSSLGMWQVCKIWCAYSTKYSDGAAFKYRAIKQKPVEPHAELKAMYEQQVKNGTTGFYLWEFLHLKTNEWRVIPADAPPLFINPVKYRCTPKPTCQVRNEDTGELKTMTREAAKKLQAELGDTVEWFLQYLLLPSYSPHAFDASDDVKDCIYSYKLKDKPLKQEAEQAIKDARKQLVENFVIMLDENFIYLSPSIYAKLKELLND